VPPPTLAKKAGSACMVRRESCDSSYAPGTYSLATHVWRRVLQASTASLLYRRLT
jgi:hypothetical protein